MLFSIGSKPAFISDETLINNFFFGLLMYSAHTYQGHSWSFAEDDLTGIFYTCWATAPSRLFFIRDRVLRGVASSSSSSLPHWKGNDAQLVIGIFVSSEKGFGPVESSMQISRFDQILDSLINYYFSPLLKDTFHSQWLPDGGPFLL